MSCVDEKIIEETNKILEKYKKEKDNLIPILNDIQVKFGYIPKRSQIEISKYLQIPMAEIFGVITFYSRFSLEPKRKIIIYRMFRYSLLCKRFTWQYLIG